MKINKKNQFQIGETFQFGLIRLKCVISGKGNYCTDCFFHDTNCDEIYTKVIGSCAKEQRYDKTDVIFVKSED